MSNSKGIRLKNNRIRWTALALVLVSVNESCALFDWRCTKGGNWSSYYDSADPRCHGFCADPEQKYCGRTPKEAEALQFVKDPAFQAVREQVRIDKANEEQRLMAADRVFCRDLGFKEETEGFANCLLTRYRDHQSESNEQQRRLESEYQKQAEEMAQNRRAIANSLQKMRPTNCDTIKGLNTSHTTCY